MISVDNTNKQFAPFALLCRGRGKGSNCLSLLSMLIMLTNLKGNSEIKQNILTYVGQPHLKAFFKEFCMHAFS